MNSFEVVLLMIGKPSGLFCRAARVVLSVPLHICGDDGLYTVLITTSHIFVLNGSIFALIAVRKSFVNCGDSITHFRVYVRPGTVGAFVVAHGLEHSR